MLATRSDETIRDATLIVDRQRFVRCEFINCQLIYLGRDEVDFEDCTFVDCDWTFDEAAGRTLGYLSTIAHQVGADGGKIVRAVFDGVIDGRVAEARDIEISGNVRASIHASADVRVEQHAAAS